MLTRHHRHCRHHCLHPRRYLHSPIVVGSNSMPWWYRVECQRNCSWCCYNSSIHTLSWYWYIDPRLYRVLFLVKRSWNVRVLCFCRLRRFYWTLCSAWYIYHTPTLQIDLQPCLGSLTPRLTFQSPSTSFLENKGVDCCGQCFVLDCCCN